MYHIYSSMLGGFIAMDFKSRHEALSFILNYHDKTESKLMSIIYIRR